ncbi:uncharacterized protein LOC112163847 [Rosa chinensis]|uniref:uncharacterized protein LOC112163847 n=1 Tax=Rosa chinensis TaxID=74649 RepID=UPI000D090306|nr:uncharacterized protein LOC112163847 [Rosa chinensis]
MSASIRARVSSQMAYKVKRAALLEVDCSIKYQFSMLRDYGNELIRADPDTTVDIKCDFSITSKNPVFKRMYICLGALKNGIKAGCRSVIGLDGAHLKSAFGGQLLIAVGLDANDTSWVIAYAMVEMENKDSWIWFLQLLCKDLEIEEYGAGWVFISDKQKGLKPAFEEVVPSAHIRFCVRHMWTNFTKLFPGKVMKDQMWKCAKSTTMPYYLNDMEEMKALDEDAYNWMTARKKPLVIMFEEIRLKLMKRIQVLEKSKAKAATNCTPTFNGEDEAEVENIEGNKNVVNLRLRTCSCRRWDLTGIACKHAVSAINFLRQDLDEYVADCYFKKRYMAIYSNFIKAVNSMDLWGRYEDPPILPPTYSRQPAEGKLGRQQRSLKCGNCHQVGHNVKTCQRHLPPKENKKRKVNNEEGQGSDQAKRGKKGSMSANELRKKARERAEYQRVIS